MKTKIGADFYSQFLENDFLPSQWNLNSGWAFSLSCRHSLGSLHNPYPRIAWRARCTTKKSRCLSQSRDFKAPFGLIGSGYWVLLVLIGSSWFAGLNPGNSRGKMPPQVLGVNGGGRCRSQQVQEPLWVCGMMSQGTRSREVQDPLWACSMMSQGTRSRQVQDPLWACVMMSQGTRSHVVQDPLWACGMMSQGTRSCEVQDPLWACSQMSQDTTEHLYMLAGVGFGVCVWFLLLKE